MVGMTMGTGRNYLFMVMLAAGCGGGGGGSAGQTDSGTDSDSGVDSQTSTGPGPGSNSESQSSPTEDAGSNSDTQTGSTTEGESQSTADITITGTGSTPSGDPTSQGTSETLTTDPGTDSDTSTGDTGSETTDSASDSDSEGESSTTDACVPSAEVCNDLDDDCDGIVDDVDVGGDGICDCLSIALLGNKGANPSAQFEIWLEMQGTTVDRIQTNNVPLDAVTLQKYDIVVLDWLIRDYTPAEADTLRQWIENGGGMMSLTGFVNNNTVRDRPNSLMAPLGLAYNTNAGFFSGPVTQFAPHPITDGLTSISFYGGLFIDVAPNNGGTNATIMTLPQGPVGVVQERKEGHVFVFGDEWVEFDSEWQQIPQIKQFWAQSLQWLAPENFCFIPQ